MFALLAHEVHIAKGGSPRGSRPSMSVQMRTLQRKGVQEQVNNLTRVVVGYSVSVSGDDVFGMGVHNLSKIITVTEIECHGSGPRVQV